MENSALRRVLDRLRSKMTSQSGASITYALLLFLVCAVVSSVVLAAGTAAAGRMTRLGEGNQVYYNVTSTVEYLNNLLDGKSVTIKDTTIKDSKTQEPLSDTFLAEISQDAVKIKKKDSVSTKKYTIHNGSGSTVSMVTNMVSQNDDDSILIMTLSGSDEETGNPFKIDLSFTASVEKWTDKKNVTAEKVVWGFYNIKMGESSEPESNAQTNATP